MKKVYVATIQILVDANSADDASDVITNALTLRSPVDVLDWSYLRLGAQNTYPSVRYISNNYKEGDFLK